MEKFNFLIIGDANHQYIINFSKWLRAVTPGIVISIISTNPKTNTDHNKEVYNNQFVALSHSSFISRIRGVKRFYIRWKILKLIRTERSGSDAILVHFASSWMASLSKQIKRATKNYIVALWGSDFYRTDDKTRLDNFFYYANNVIIGSPQMIDDFEKYFNKYIDKVSLCFFGNEPIEYLKKIKEDSITRDRSCSYLNLSTTKINVTIGHNGSRGHQHLNILNRLKNLNTETATKICVIIPLTYGLDKEYLNSIKSICDECPFEYRIFTEYMTETTVAHFRNSTDIMINLQITDAFSGSMREVLFSGGVVITGSWLPYQFLKNNGVYYEEVNSINEISDKLTEVVENYSLYKDRCQDNLSKIYDLSSWSSTIHSWKNVIEQKR